VYQILRYKNTDHRIFTPGSSTNNSFSPLRLLFHLVKQQNRLEKISSFFRNNSIITLNNSITLLIKSMITINQLITIHNNSFIILNKSILSKYKIFIPKYFSKIVGSAFFIPGNSQIILRHNSSLLWYVTPYFRRNLCFG